MVLSERVLYGGVRTKGWLSGGVCSRVCLSKVLSQVVAFFWGVGSSGSV